VQCRRRIPRGAVARRQQTADPDPHDSWGRPIPTPVQPRHRYGHLTSNLMGVVLARMGSIRRSPHASGVHLPHIVIHSRHPGRYGRAGRVPSSDHPRQGGQRGVHRYRWLALSRSWVAPTGELLTALRPTRRSLTNSTATECRPCGALSGGGCQVSGLRPGTSGQRVGGGRLNFR
jgi:hypothetical protein